MMLKIGLTVGLLVCCLAPTYAHEAMPMDTCKIPTAVTPNSDGKNDVLEIDCLKNIGVKNDSELTIYSRWGEKIFYAKPYYNNFDGTYRGTRLPDGTYLYIFKFDGVQHQGNLTVIR